MDSNFTSASAYFSYPYELEVDRATLSIHLLNTSLCSIEQRSLSPGYAFPWTVSYLIEYPLLKYSRKSRAPLHKSHVSITYPTHPPHPPVQMKGGNLSVVPLKVAEVEVIRI